MMNVDWLVEIMPHQHCASSGWSRSIMSPILVLHHEISFQGCEQHRGTL